MLIFVYLEGDAAFEVDPDFGLDITAVDTTLGDDDVQPFYPKEIKHGGFDMSKLLFCYWIQINFVYIRFVFDEGEYVTQFDMFWKYFVNRVYAKWTFDG